ncbi:hypothetical protein AAY473_022223 [Plecturocebus cupreus]
MLVLESALFYGAAGLALSPLRLECSGAILAHSNLSASRVQVIFLSQPPEYTGLQARATTGVCHYARLIFVFLVEMGFHHVGQAVLELLTSGDPPTRRYCHATSSRVQIMTNLHSPTLAPRLGYSGAITAHCSFNLLGSSYPTALSLPTRWDYHCWSQTPGFRDPPASAILSLGITGMSHRAQPK